MVSWFQKYLKETQKYEYVKSIKQRRMWHIHCSSVLRTKFSVFLLLRKMCNMDEVSMQCYRLTDAGENQNAHTSENLLLCVHVAARHNSCCCHRAGEFSQHRKSQVTSWQCTIQMFILIYILYWNYFIYER
jgi:hypothetical protein